MKKVLVVGASWLGDMVMAQTLLILLKEKGAVIDVLAPEWNFAVLKCMPEINQAIPMPIGHGELKLKQRYQLGKRLKNNHYDEAYILPNSFKSALIPYFAKIPKRTGWLGEMRYGLLNDVRKLDEQEYPLMVQRFAALAYAKKETWNKESYPKPKLIVNENSVQETLTKFNLSVHSTQPIIALCPGAAFGDSKRWPYEYFAEIANEKLNAGWQVWLFGSEKDKEVTEKIQQATQNRCSHLAGQLQLNETVNLLSKTRIVISNDSGLLHVAAALDIPLIGIYGSTTADFTPPLSDKKAILGVDNLNCRPCFQRHCQFGHLKCLKDILPAQVQAAIEKLVV